MHPSKEMIAPATFPEETVRAGRVTSRKSNVDPEGTDDETMDIAALISPPIMVTPAVEIPL